MSDTLDFIAKKIKQYRENQELSIKQLADKSQSTVQYIYQVEGAKANLSVNKLEAICQALGIHIQDVLPLSPTVDKSMILNKISSLPTNKELVLEIVNLCSVIQKERDLKIIRDILKSMQENS
jgi:transcriptional regulator with XRE-family HTH domain